MSDTSTQKNGPQSRNRIVAFVDILGASQAVLLGQTIDLVGDIFQLGRTMRWTHRIHLRKADGTTEKQEFRPGIAQFSDCLLLWSDPLDGLPPDQFVRTAASFLCNLSAEMGRLLLAGIPFRAGVSEGPVFIYPELNIYAGRPIVEAAKLESCQNWLGAAMLFADQSDRLIRWPDQNSMACDSAMFESFVVPGVPVPLKKDAPDFLLKNMVLPLNWALSVQESQGPSYLDFWKKLQKLQAESGSRGQEKYTMAMQFLTTVEQQFPILEHNRL